MEKVSSIGVVNITLNIFSYVSPPRPIEVKKLIANRVFFGLSRGRRPSNADESSLKWWEKKKKKKLYRSSVTYVL